MQGRAPSRNIGQPDRESAGMIRDLLLGMCLDGECYELAIALSRGTGLQLVGIWDPLSSGEDRKPGTWRHAVVRMGALFWDARGQVTPEQLGKPFGLRQPLDIRDITEADLFAVRPIREQAIKSTMKMAQAAWPDLPWLPTTHQGRMAAFLSDLEELSRRHGVWIRSPYPAAAPMLAQGDGDEVGYRARLTSDGLAVMFDRSYDVFPLREDHVSEPDDEIGAES